MSGPVMGFGIYLVVWELKNGEKFSTVSYGHGKRTITKKQGDDTILKIRRLTPYEERLYWDGELDLSE